MMHVKGTVAVHVTERVCDRCGGWGDERAAQDEPGLPGALVRCPKCNSQSVEQRISAFYAQTSKKS